MSKNSFKVIIMGLCFMLLISFGIVQPVNASEWKEKDFSLNPDAEIIEMEAEALEEGLGGFFGLIEEMPIEVAEAGIEEGVQWLNDNKGDEFYGKVFIADGENVDLIADPNMMTTYGIVACGAAIVGAITMNAWPWAKILKVKKAVQLLGGSKVMAKTLVTAYKHQRNLGYSKATAAKRAIDVTKRALPGEYVKALTEFLSLKIELNSM